MGYSEVERKVLIKLEQALFGLPKRYSNETCKWVIDSHNPTASFEQKLLYFKRRLALFWEALCYHDEVTTGDIMKDVIREHENSNIGTGTGK